MANEHLNLRDGLEGDEQYQVALGRIAAVATARNSIQRVNPDASEADAIFVTGVLDLDGKASFELLDASKQAYAGFNFETGEIAGKARAQLIVALSKSTCAERPLDEDFGIPYGKNAAGEIVPMPYSGDGFGPVED